MTLPHRDPYLWIHLAGLATVPLWLDICLAGLAVGDPVVAPGVELFTLGLVGTLPILWMQLRRPFYIFSLPGLALRPDQLSVERRRLLSLQRTLLSRLLVICSAIALLMGLYWLYQLAPIAADMTPFAAKSRPTGWAIAAIAFLCANLFVQVPATVIPLLLTSPTTHQKTEAFESTAILKKFMVIGLRLERILPDLLPAEGLPVAETTSPTIPHPAAEAMPISETLTPSPPTTDTPATSDAPSTSGGETAGSLDDEIESDPVSAPSHLSALVDAPNDSQANLADTESNLADTDNDASASALSPDAPSSSPNSPLTEVAAVAPIALPSESLVQDITVDSSVEPEARHDTERAEDHNFGASGVLEVAEIADPSTTDEPPEPSRIEGDDIVIPTELTASDAAAITASDESDFQASTASSADDVKASVLSQES
ncbi:MAG: low-complexity tail membrane protein [Cyanobacteria bacterium P01_D01_bin.115]